MISWFPFLNLAEIGDFDEAADHEHLSKNTYMPQQDDLEEKIMEYHRNHLWVLHVVLILFCIYNLYVILLIPCL